ncbi:hypothetical protein WA158_001451 [Blastocystis sp. Blastoise]
MEEIQEIHYAPLVLSDDDDDSDNLSNDINTNSSSLEQLEKITKDYELQLSDYFHGILKITSLDDNREFDQRRQTIVDLINEKLSCPICMTEITISEQIYMCGQCHGITHLECSIAAASRRYKCPLCNLRLTHDPKEASGCFCGETPDFVSSLEYPHTCLKPCPKRLPCGHYCHLLCHPGNCPPCKLTMFMPCLCGKTKINVPCQSDMTKCKELVSSMCKEPIRILCNCQRMMVDSTCNKRHVSCNNPCHSVLHTIVNPITNHVDSHMCEMICHEGACPPCDRMIRFMCPCGQTKMPAIPCSLYRYCYDLSEFYNESIYFYLEQQGIQVTCALYCNKLLPCGNHLCESPCHYGPCTPCWKSKKLTDHCDCGACLLSAIPYNTNRCVSQWTTQCQFTCNKIMSCGHPCSYKCHKGPCPSCFKETVIQCSCGLSSITVPCKDVKKNLNYKCHTICDTLLSCGKHKCKKRCCPNKGILNSDNPYIHICQEKCSKLCSCSLHRCSQLCHSDTCLECTTVLTDSYSCPCSYIHLTSPYICSQYKPSYKYIHICIRPFSCGHNTIPSPLLNKFNTYIQDLCNKFPYISYYLQDHFQLSFPEIQPLSHPFEIDQYNISTNIFENHLDSYISSLKETYPQYTLHLCHQGKCPPCTAIVSRFCNRHNQEYSVTCSGINNDEGCPLLCNQKLPCGHTCQRRCHEGPCNSIPCESLCLKERTDCHHICKHKCHFGHNCVEYPCDESIDVTCSCGLRTESCLCSNKNHDISCSGFCYIHLYYPYILLYTHEYSSLSNNYTSKSLMDYLDLHNMTPMVLYYYIMFTDYFSQLEHMICNNNNCVLQTLVPPFIPYDIIISFVSHYSVGIQSFSKETSILLISISNLKALKEMFSFEALIADILPLINKQKPFKEQYTINEYSKDVSNILLLNLLPSKDINNQTITVPTEFHKSFTCILSKERMYNNNKNIYKIYIQEYSSIPIIIRQINKIYAKQFLCIPIYISPLSYSSLLSASSLFIKDHFSSDSLCSVYQSVANLSPSVSHLLTNNNQVTYNQNSQLDSQLSLSDISKSIDENTTKEQIRKNRLERRKNRKEKREQT